MPSEIEIMTKIAKILLIPLTIFALGSFKAGAQSVFEDKVSFQTTVHNFGDIPSDGGEVSFTFVFKNISEKPVAVYTVNSSCGCTVASWSKEPVLPGKTSEIKAVYKNEDGPVTFDKTLSCYISGLSKPVILHLRGTCYDSSSSFASRYPVTVNASDGKPLVGFKKASFTLRSIAMGRETQDEIEVANLSRKTLKISFIDASQGVSPGSAEIAPGKVAVIKVAQSSMEGKWGRNSYYATPQVRDSKDRILAKGKPLEFEFFTLEDFSGYTQAEKVLSAKPIFRTSTVFAGELKSSSKPVEVVFEFENVGKKPLIIHKIDCPEGVECKKFPSQTNASAKDRITFVFDPSKVKERGEIAPMVTVVTNSPARPLVNLFIAAVIND